MLAIRLNVFEYSVHLCVYIYTVYKYVRVNVLLSHSICLLFYLCVCLFVCLYVCLFDCLFVCPSIYMFFVLSTFVFVYLSMHLSNLSI